MNKNKFKSFNLLLFLLIFVLSLPVNVFAGSTDYKFFDSASDVSVNKDWTIKFSHAVSEKFLTSDFIKVIRNSDGQLVNNPKPKLSDEVSVKLAPPVNNYDHNTKYTLIVEGVESKQGKILNPPVKKQFVTEAPPQLTVIGEKNEIVEDPTKNNSIDYENKAIVEIPANTVSSGAKVSIQEVSGAKLHAFKGLETHVVYNISMDTDFNDPLILRFKYDPSILNSKYDATDQLTVAYFNEGYNRWIESDFILDEAANQIIVSTDHLSLWSISGTESDTVIVNAPHFRIYYNKNLNGPWLIGEPTSPDYIIDQLDKFVGHVRSTLIDAYEKYEAEGYDLPNMTKVYIDDWGPDETAQWGWFSKNIEIPIQQSYYSKLQHECAHELFHAVQNEYVLVPDMMLNRWWVEATADYAAARIFGTGILSSIDANYLQKSMDITDGKREYQAAHFIDYLVRYKGLDFKPLWHYTTYNWSSDMLPVIDDYLKAIGTSLSECYSGFAQYLFFNGNIPGLDLANCKTPYELATYKSQMPLAVKELDKRQFVLSDKYTAQLWAIKPEVANLSSSRNLMLELDEDLPSGMSVKAFVLNDHQWTTDLMAPSATLHSANKSAPVTVEPGEILFILVSNGTSSGQSTAVKVKELEFTIDPSALDEVKTNKVYDFILEAKNIPKQYTSVKFVWDFGDEETGDYGNLSKDKEIVPISDGEAKTVISHKYLKGDETYYLQVEMQDLDGKIIAKAASVITIPEEEVKVFILPPRIVTYELMDGAMEAVHDFEAAVTPAGEYVFEWDFGDGSALQSTTGSDSKISHTYRGKGTYKPKVQVYDLSGNLLGKDSIEVVLEAVEISEELVFSRTVTNDDMLSWQFDEALKKIGAIKVRSNGDFSETVGPFEGVVKKEGNDFLKPYNYKVKNFHISGNFDSLKSTGTATVSYEIEFSQDTKSYVEKDISGRWTNKWQIDKTMNYTDNINIDLTISKLIGNVIQMEGEYNCNRIGSLETRSTVILCEDDPYGIGCIDPGTGYPKVGEVQIDDLSKHIKDKVTFQFYLEHAK